MSYKTNYEPYVSYVSHQPKSSTSPNSPTLSIPKTSSSIDMDERRTSEELLYPLGSLYPHVVALQLQSDENPWTRAKNFAAYQETGYWSESAPSSPASSSFSFSEHLSKSSMRRYSGDSTACKFVSRIRRFLSRDEMRRRQRHA